MVRVMKLGRVSRKSRGFTLLELVIVMTIMVILLAVSIPIYRNLLLRARETVLRDDLFKMRDAINRYTYDKNRAPESLKDLERAKYLREIPIDPLTESRDTWVVRLEDEPVVPSAPRGIVDVFSGAEGIGTDGVPYNEW
ncbi:prepilin-type N-terminal cleavage/methylation domain-containing protein [Chloracidobacterium validum]|uniref:Prepilin-type N-terminal cleavage/methylation domain-containing protein n=2 Tax=Chloracidobacterium validum TaxID=2821543 RepID=A0ABX8B9P4_9BACT|nr:prepilin-type N-terminal cleavage/methylation domain-containing protein [Chloracidobacterium validum]